MHFFKSSLFHPGERWSHHARVIFSPPWPSWRPQAVISNPTPTDGTSKTALGDFNRFGP